MTQKPTYEELAQKVRLLEEKAAKREWADQRKYSALVESSMDAILMTAPDGRILFCNQAACNMFQMTEQELVEGGRAAVVDENDPRLSEALQKRAELRKYRVELRYKRKDGTFFDGEVSSVIFEDMKGQKRTSMVIRDVSDRKRAETRLALQAKIAAVFAMVPDEEMFHEVLKLILDETESPFGVFGYLDETDALVVPTMSRQQVWEECQVSEKSIRFPKETWRESSWVRAIREKNANYSNEASTKVPAGHVKIERHISWPIQFQGEVIGLFQVANKETDYTEADLRTLENIESQVSPLLNARLQREVAEAARRKLQNQFLQAQKMESVGRLAGGVAHDFNNMLSVILGYTQLAMADLDRTDPMYGKLEEVLNAGNRSVDIVRQLLAFARKQTIDPRMLDLNATVEGMLKMLSRLIGEDIELVWEPALNLWPVMMDPSQIDQILANLCVNARDAILGTGKITIETENTVLDEEYCAAHAGFKPGEFVILAVSDDGRGMDRETLNKVFDPFFTTKEMGKGTGLGLATVYGIVKQNEGVINAYSELDKGTSFSIYLPRHEGETEGGIQAEVMEAQKAHGETVLIVEDDASVLQLGKKILDRLGYTVLTSQSPVQAVDLVSKHTGKIHLLITDVVMPEMNGKDLADAVTAMRPDIRTLFMSGYTANTVVHHGILDKEVNFIEKPLTLDRLARKVREAMKG